MRRIPHILTRGLPVVARGGWALVLLGSLSGCLFSGRGRYLEVRGTVPTPSTLPVLAPSTATRASLRVGAGLSSTTSPSAHDPQVNLDLRAPLSSGQVDGLVSLGSHVVLGYRQVVEGGDVLFGIVGRPGPFQILGYGATGLRRFRLDRTYEHSFSNAGFSDGGDPPDTIFLSSRTLGIASTIGLSCLTNLAEGRLQPFVSASLQMGPRLAGEIGGNTYRDESLAFGAATLDVGTRVNFTTHIGVTVGAGLVSGTGVFHDTWARGFAALEWSLGR